LAPFVFNCHPRGVPPVRARAYPNPTSPIIKAPAPLTLILVAAVLAALPGAAAAAPPDNDHYLFNQLMHPGGTFSNPGPFPEPPSVPGLNVDTSEATEQGDLYNPPGSGGPPEPLACQIGPGQVSEIRKTMWMSFRPHRYGRMKIQTSGGFDSTILVMPFDAPDDPTPRPEFGFCTDRLSGFSEDFGDDRNIPPVIRGAWYAVQVGGFRDPNTGNAGGGPVEARFEFLRPATIGGADAVLRGSGTSSGIRVSELAVTGPRGARIEVTCTRGGCRRDTATARLGDPPAFMRPLGKVLPPDPASDVEMTGASGKSPSPPLARLAATRAAASPIARTARTRKFLRGRRLRAGVKIEVRITSPGMIGRYFSFTVARGRPKPKVRRCLEPFSRKPQRRCNG
jgi:hypothetical protein